MKKLLALSLLLPLASIAATPPVSGTAQTASTDAAIDRQMADLQTRMNDLAKRMAALSTRLGDQASASVLRYLADSRRGMLGMAVSSEDDGFHVDAVTPGGPAERAGLRAGDVITGIDGKPFSTRDASVFDGLSALQPGKPARLTVMRAGKALHIEATPERLQADDWRATVRAAERAARAASASVNTPEFRQHLQQQIDAMVRDASRAREVALDAAAPAGTWRMLAPWWGLNLAPLNQGLGRYFGTESGALVLSRDAKRYPELEAGDVITRIGDRTISSPQDAMRAFREAPNDKPIRLDVRRHDKDMAVTLKSPPRWLALPPPPPPAPPAPPSPPSPPSPATPATPAAPPAPPAPSPVSTHASPQS